MSESVELPIQAPGTVFRCPAGTMRGTLSLAGLLLVLMPLDVLACATCSLREPESAVRSALLVVGLMLTPFLVVGVGLWAVRRAGREDGA
ncbi:hypothetical protein HUA78_40715 [Myxococcus sp. CA033]|nr:hypothetical protein [Myxococcus sp. CA033]